MDEFTEIITKELASNDANADEDDANALEDDDNASIYEGEEGQLVHTKEYRMISRTLRSVAKAQSDYETLLVRMKNLQNSCQQAIYGLSQCISALVDMIVAGECNTGAHPGYLEFSQIDLQDRGIGEGAQVVSLLAPIREDVIKLFNFEGFYKVLCAVVGQKNLNKHKVAYP